MGRTQKIPRKKNYCGELFMLTWQERLSNKLVESRKLFNGTPCWLFSGAIQNTGGYGLFWISGKLQLTHRITYEYLKGPIPPGLYIDHLCRVPRCCNPAHLEAVTPAENNHRALLVTRDAFCPHGHEYTPENTYADKGRPNHRRCRTCRRDRARKDRRRRRQTKPENYRIRESRNKQAFLKSREITTHTG